MSDVIKENDEKDEEIVIIEEKPEGKSEDLKDDQVKSSDDDDDDEEDERESIRERRRQEKLERKQRREEAIKRDKLELDFLRKRNDDLERRVSAQEQRTHKLDLSAFDAEIAKANNEIVMADRVISKAIAAGNGDDVTQAMRYRDAAMAKVQQLTFQKQRVASQPPQSPKPQQIDDLTMRHAQDFIKDNPWYDAQGRDEDSAIVIAIDQALAKAGYDPRTPEYWDELRNRAARRLPERFGAEDKTPSRRAEDKSEARREPRGGPAVGSGREHAPPSTRKEIYISPERKQALIDAGVWDDPVLRTRYIKRYAEYDRNNKG